MIARLLADMDAAFSKVEVVLSMSVFVFYTVCSQATKAHSQATKATPLVVQHSLLYMYSYTHTGLAGIFCQWL